MSIGLIELLNCKSDLKNIVTEINSENIKVLDYAEPNLILVDRNKLSWAIVGKKIDAIIRKNQIRSTI